MDDFIYQQQMLYDLPQDYHEPHDYPPRKTKAKPTYFDLSKPYREEGGSRVNVYHVKGINKSIKPPMTYEAEITAESTYDATQVALMEMGWQGEIKSCRMVS